MPPLPQLRVAVATIAFLPLVAACGTTGGAASSGAGERLAVVAAENFWGSIASQLGGERVTVTSIVTNPDADPHTYEPTPEDGRTLARARYVIANGAGYDPWVPKLVNANPSPARDIVTIADLAGRKEGDNPHMWYSPPIVTQVADRITADYKRLDPTDATFFDQQATTFRSTELRQYDVLRQSIRSRFASVPVGATESIFMDLATDLGLNLITPPDYMRALSEGTDPTAADKSTVDSQISRRQMKVLVVNSQNSTPDIQALADRATRSGIPIVRITETLTPPTATFQEWQAGQLKALQSALATTTGR